jgi:L-lactate permease
LIWGPVGSRAVDVAVGIGMRDGGHGGVHHRQYRPRSWLLKRPDPLVGNLLSALLIIITAVVGGVLWGSATFSNMRFALPLQFSVADKVSAPEQVVLAAQMPGSNAGNMVSVQNVVAAAAVAGLLGKEGTIIRSTFLPMLYYCTTVGALTLLLAHVP